MLPCSNVITIHQDNLYCNNCKHGYVIYQQEHTCNDILVKCGMEHISLIEKYILPVDFIEHDYDTINCNKCAKKIKKESAPKLTTCPECEYRGYYKHNGDKLCLVCVSKNNTPIIDVNNDVIDVNIDVTNVNTDAIIDVNVVNSPHATKLNMKIFFDIDTTGYIPGDGKCISINIFGVPLNGTNIPQWDKDVKKISLIMDVNGIANDIANDNYQQWIKKSMHELSAFMYNISNQYNFKWNETSSIKFEWLKYLYNTYGHDDRFSILR